MARIGCDLKLDAYIRTNLFSGGASKAGPRASDFLKESLAQVDGLLAGFRLLDTTKTEDDQPARGGLLADLDELLDDSSFSTHGSTASPGSDTLPSSQQWAALETVYDACNLYFKLFQEAAPTFNCAIITKLASDFDSPRALRNRAGSVFRKVLQNTSKPGKLDAVFAFVSLSYIITKLLVKEKRFPKDRLLAGLHVWRGELSEPDRVAFDRLGRRLWPDAPLYLHSYELPPERADLRPVREVVQSVNAKEFSVPSPQPPISSIVTGPSLGHDLASISTSSVLVQTSEDINCPGWSEFSNYNPLATYQSNLVDLFGQAVASGLEFSTFADIANLQGIEATDNPPPEEPSQGETTQLLDTWPSLPPASEHTGDHNSPHRGALPMETRTLDDPPSPGTPRDANRHSHVLADKRADSDCSLENTDVFQAVIQFCASLCGLFWTLTGQGTTSMDDSDSLHGQDKLEFVEWMERDFFRPLKQTLPEDHHPAFLGIIAMAELFVKFDQLRTSRTVRAYCLNVAMKILPSDTFVVFSDWMYRSPVIREELSRLPTPSPKKTQKRKRSDTVEQRYGASKIRSSFSCTICGMRFTQRSNQSRHETYSHGGREAIKCPVDGCVFSNKRRDNVRKHFHSKHEQVSMPRFLQKEIS